MMDPTNRGLSFIGILLVFALLNSNVALAQDATITGRITDPSDGVIPSVTITLSNVETGIKVTTVTNNEGNYVFPFLRPGNYRLATALPGFKPVVRSGIKLDVQQVARIDFVLEVGTLDQEMNVVEKTPRLENETSSVGQLVDNKTIVTLPLNGRNFSQLAVLTPGAVPNQGSRAVDGFSLNGNRTLQNTFLLDGIENNNHLLGVVTGSTQALRPSIDAIQEFKVETANYSAEFGRAAGGVISVSVKSGTNEFHGSAFEFLRNDALDANDFFSNRSGLKRPPLRYNQFGGTLGGPILRNRTFFFASYQGTRILQSDTITTTVPSADMVRGQFGSVAIYDPLDVVDGMQRPFFNNIIPENRMDPVGRRLAALYPAPNLPGEVNNYVSNVRSKNDRGQSDARLDHRIGAKDNLFARYSRAIGKASQGSVFGPPGNGGGQFQLPTLTTVTTYSVAVNETHIFSSALVNEGRVGYTKNASDRQVLAPMPLYDEFGIKGIPRLPNLTGLPSILVTGFSALGDLSFIPDQKRVQVLQLSDNFSWVRGNHTWTFGADGRLRKNLGVSSASARGVFTFDGRFTARVPGQRSGSALADLLLGQTSSALLSTQQAGDLRDYYYGFFINDTWKLTRKLTLNLGLRYELQTPMWERRNAMSNFDADPRSPTFGQLVPATNGSIRLRTFANLDKYNLAPRTGFAYEISPRTVLRGAFGIFYGGLGYQALIQSGVANLPNFVSITVGSSINAARSSLILANGFSSGTLAPENAQNPAAHALAPNFPMPEIYQWNLELQRGWIGDTVLSLAYVGSGSSYLRGLNDINAPAPGPGPLDPRRPFPAFGAVTLSAPFAHATYHSMQVKVERRFSQGVSLLASHTWSHSIDNSLDPEVVPDTGPRFPQNPNNTSAEKSSSGIDVRHRFVCSGIYDLPIGRQGRWMGNTKVIRTLLGGWQLSGIFVAQSGLFLTPTVSPNPANTTTPPRPNRLRDGNLPGGARRMDRWFDPSAFTPAAQFTFGNSGRNVLRAPGLVNLDLLLARNFQITESKRLELRGEFFNLTNSVHFGRPDLTINQPQAGQITSTQMPNRQVQIGLRFVF